MKMSLVTIVSEKSEGNWKYIIKWNDEIFKATNGS